MAQVGGVGEPGMVLQVLVNNRVVAQATVGSNGAWSAQAPIGQPGQYRFSVRGVMADGVLLAASTEPVIVVVPTPAAAATPPSTPAPISNALELVEPNDGDSGTGQRRFAWRTEFVPPEGQAFELIFWRDGEDPLVNGIGLSAPTTTDGVTVNLSMLDHRLGELLEPGQHRWGVLLVRISPYERLQFFGASRMFRYFRSGDGGSSSDGESSGGEQSSGE
jgi:hypothetical protein